MGSKQADSPWRMAHHKGKSKDEDGERLKKKKKLSGKPAPNIKHKVSLRGFQTSGSLSATIVTKQESHPH